MKFNKQLFLRALMHVFADIIIISALLFLAYWALMWNFTQKELIATLIYAALYIALKITVFVFFGVYKMITSNFGIVESLKIMVLSIVTSLIFMLPMYFIPVVVEISIPAFILIAIVEAFLLAAARYIKRILVIFLKGRKKTPENKRTLVIGAGAGGKMVLDETRTNDSLKNRIVVFVDDDPLKIGGLFSNIRVEGPIATVASVIEKYRIEEVVVAIANLDKASLYGILKLLEHSDVKVKRLPLMSEISQDKQRNIVDVDINELLGRETVYLDSEEIHEFIRGKTVLVTGAGGSIGSELVRQIFKYRPQTIVLFDIYENGVYDIQQELVRETRKLNVQGVKIETLIGSTYNLERMEQIFSKYKPNLVFHAAAYKHVPLMEDSPMEAIRTNIFGTYNVAVLSEKYGVQKMVLVSTDKAVRPTNVMGATKAFAEMIIRYFSSQKSKTSFSAVRFGNVLGSNGSVIPLFKKQIESGGPVTVTDPNITRFFMTIPEAVGLILQSGVYATGGEIFILDMGKPIRIVELAEKMIRQSGYVPYKEMKIEFVGLRPGEKLYEELLLDVTTQKRTANSKIFIEQSVNPNNISLDLKEFDEVFHSFDETQTRALLKKKISSYSYTNK